MRQTQPYGNPISSLVSLLPPAKHWGISFQMTPISRNSAYIFGWPLSRRETLKRGPFQCVGSVPQKSLFPHFQIPRTFSRRVRTGKGLPICIEMVPSNEVPSPATPGTTKRRICESLGGDFLLFLGAPKNNLNQRIARRGDSLCDLNRRWSLAPNSQGVWKADRVTARAMDATLGALIMVPI